MVLVLRASVISNLSLDLNSIFLYNLFLLFFSFSLVTLHLEEKTCFVIDYATIFYGRLWCSIYFFELASC